MAPWALFRNIWAWSLYDVGWKCFPTRPMLEAHRKEKEKIRSWPCARYLVLVRAHAHAVADLPPSTVTAGAASRSLAEGRGGEKREEIGVEKWGSAGAQRRRWVRSWPRRWTAWTTAASCTSSASSAQSQVRFALLILRLPPTSLGEMTESRIRKTAGNWRRNCRIGGGCWRCRGTGQN